MEKLKKYRVKISGGLTDEIIYRAPNKTIARKALRGELNPWIKIVKIEEVIHE